MIPPFRHSLAATLILVGGPTLAQDSPTFAVGLFGAASTSPFDDNTTDTAILPDIEVSGDSYTIGLSGLSYDVIQTETFALSLRAAPRFFDDPSEVDGLEDIERDIAVEAGLGAEYRIGMVALGLEALGDVSDTHEGTALRASLGTALPVTERLGVAAEIGATWMDSKLATYSYGILPDEARGTLPAYEIDEAIIPFLGIQARYGLTDQVALIGAVSVEALPDEVTDSPIVTRDTVAAAMLGMRYEF